MPWREMLGDTQSSRVLVAVGPDSAAAVTAECDTLVCVGWDEDGLSAAAARLGPVRLTRPIPAWPPHTETLRVFGHWPVIAAVRRASR